MFIGFKVNNSAAASSLHNFNTVSLAHFNIE